MRVHVLQHMPFERIGCIAAWLAERGAEVTWTRFYQPEPQLPTLTDYDLIVAMGGPMSVNDEAQLPWLKAEKAFLRRAIDDSRAAVLGVCLGGQLIASAMGARVGCNGGKEIGFHPVRGLPVSQPDAFEFPAQTTLMHWHGETFALPEGAVHLASSEGCRNQAFQLGRRVIGLQCHPEMTPPIVSALLHEFASDLQPGRWVQDASRIAGAGPQAYAPGNALMVSILEYLTAA